MGVITETGPPATTATATPVCTHLNLRLAGMDDGILYGIAAPRASHRSAPLSVRYCDPLRLQPSISAIGWIYNIHFFADGDHLLSLFRVGQRRGGETAWNDTIPVGYSTVW